jgi:hypothetical protein
VSADPPTGLRRAALLVPLAFLLAAAPLANGGDDALLLPKAEIPEDRLVDVAIDLFSPGVSDAPASPLLLKGIRSAVRKSEARYVPIHLRNTLQSTGQWGAVRVVPGGAVWAELLVSGAIEKSNGKDLEVRVVARDATGRVWVEKKYKRRADTTAYAKDRPVDGRDPFQVLYNRIANDLVRAREKRKPKELAEVREVARLRFAASMAPDPYAAYLAAGKKGSTRVERLPAADDPMIVRISAIRDRDHMFVDTLNEYYADFYARMDKPYDDWRAYSYTEQAALDSINRESTLKKVLGGIAVLGGILMDPRDDHGVKDVLILGGIAAVQSGFEDGKEGGIHKAALTELADSFEGEVTPLLVDVDGKVVQLTGSAEAQFTKWRQLLQEIAATDQPLPTDINLLPAAPVEVAQP